MTQAKQSLFLSTLFLIFLATASLAGGSGGDYSSLKVGDVSKVDIDELHPTQFRVGQDEVADKTKNFEDMSPKDLKSYLKSHPCPVVIGPGGTPYITDEQHRANAATDAEDSHHAVNALKKHGDPTMYMKVVANYSNMSESQFETAMVKNHYTYLNDLGQKKSFSDLPTHVDDMKNDPFRSLAGFIEGKAYNLANVDFAQFSVADWLREHLGMSDSDVETALGDKESKEKLLQKATDLLQSPAASSEPWYLASKS